MAKAIPAILKSAPSQAVYASLMKVVRSLGPFEVEEKKTSIHLARRRAFAGVHPRAGGIVLNLVFDQPVRHARVHKSEQVSANRHHVEFKLEDPAEIDERMTGWIAEAYRLAE